jgi:hypothetical protein
MAVVGSLVTGRGKMIGGEGDHMMNEKGTGAARRRTPTELLIEAMEHAEDMEECMVIFRLTKDETGHGGMGWATEHPTLAQKFAFIEEAKLAMFHSCYGDRRP